MGVAAGGVELWSVSTSTDAMTSDIYRVVDGEAPQLVGGGGYQWLLDPTGRWMASNVPSASVDQVEPFALLDVVDGGSTEISYGVPGQSCQVVGWLDPGEILAYCLDVGYTDIDGILDPASVHAAYYRIGVATGGSSTTLLSRPATGDPRPWTWRGGWAGSGTLAFVGTLGGVNDPGGCAEDTYLWTGTTLRPLGMDPGETIFRLRSGRPLLIESQSGCSGTSTPPSPRVRRRLRDDDAAGAGATADRGRSRVVERPPHVGTGRVVARRRRAPRQDARLRCQSAGE